MKVHRKFTGRTIAIFILSGLVAQSSRAAEGDLDSTFGTGGKVTTDFAVTSDQGYSVAIQGDGKILVAGTANSDFAIARYDATGVLDPTFGTGGKVTTDFAGTDSASIVIVQPDGKILVGGISHGLTSNPDFAIARYDATGVLDPNFGTGGKVTYDFAGFRDEVSDLIFQPDGKIVAAGTVQQTNSSNSKDFALVRYNSDGSPDGTFGTAGVATADFDQRSDSAFAAIRQPDGKILVAGKLDFQLPRDSDFALFRFNADGTADTGFGIDGKAVADFDGETDTGYDVTIQSDGKIIVVGTAGFGQGTQLGLARFHPDGSLDPSFGGDGTVIANFASRAEKGSTVILQPGGKILVAGWTRIFSDYDFGLIRFHADGTIDTSFGTGGTVVTGFGGTRDFVESAALQADGKILVAGRTNAGADDDFALARFEAAPATYQPDNAVGKSAPSLGDDLYNHPSAAGQILKLTTKRAGSLRASLTVQNDGNDFDALSLRGSRGNRCFRVTYSAPGGNVTGAVVSGAFDTPTLDPGAVHPVTVKIDPNSRKVQKKIRRGKRRITIWLRKKLTLTLTSTSQADPDKKDTAKVMVHHR